MRRQLVESLNGYLKLDELTGGIDGYAVRSRLGSPGGTAWRSGACGRHDLIAPTRARTMLPTSMRKKSPADDREDAAQTAGPQLSGTNLARAGDHNQRVTLHAVRVNGPVTRTELALKTGLTPGGDREHHQPAAAATA